MLLMFNHNSEPLLKVLLHSNSTSFEQILDPFNFHFQIFQLIVFSLIVMFKLVDLTLEAVFLVSSHDLSIFIDHASESVLLANLFDLIREFFDLSPSLIDAHSKLFASTILFLK